MVPDVDKVVALAYHATEAPLTLSENLGQRLLQHYEVDNIIEEETGNHYKILGCFVHCIKLLVM